MPRKNMATVNGRPLLWYTLQNVKVAGLTDSTIVVTDDDAIEGYAMLSDVMVCREPLVVKENQMRALHYGWKYAMEHGIEADVFVCLNTTTPCFKPGLIEELVEVCRRTGGIAQDIVRSDPLAYFCQLGPDGRLTFLAENDLSQNLPPLYRMTGLFVAYPSIFDRDYTDLAAFWKWDGWRVYGVVHDDPIVDIDHEGDLRWAEFLIQSGRYPHLL